MAREVVKIIRARVPITGLYHLASPRISKYDLLVLANQVFKSGIEIQKDDSKKADKSLNCDKYGSMMKYTKPSWQDMLTELAQDNELYGRL